MKYALAALLLIAGLSFAKDKKQVHGADIQTSAYHVGKIALITSHHTYDWHGRYTSSTGSVDVYCDSSSYETNCADSVGAGYGSGHYEVTLEGDAREYNRHTLTPIAVFVEGKQIKLNRDPLARYSEQSDYDPLERAKEQLEHASGPISFTYRLATVIPRSPLYGDKGKEISVYCVPFKHFKGKTEKSAETCYQLYSEF